MTVPTGDKRVLSQLLSKNAKKVLGPARTAQLARVRDAWELTRPRHFLLVNSHMRSYSSLLCHILASSPEVNGYAEMRRSYRAEADLLALAWQVRSTNHGRLTAPVILDKLLHKTHVVSDEIIARDNVTVLISVRSPASTLPSIVAMGRGIDPDHHWASPEHACEHYISRLESLGDLAKRTPRPIVLASDRLVAAPESVLAALSSSLELHEPLQGTFEEQPLTGEAEYGDTSRFIRAGHVVSARPTHDDITIPADWADRAQRAFSDFWSIVDSHDSPRTIR